MIPSATPTAVDPSSPRSIFLAARDALAPTARWSIAEYGLARHGAVADLAYVDGEDFVGVEVKSSKDSLRRLTPPHGFQIDAYGAVFDRCAIVVAERHLQGAVRIIPEWWGLYSVRTSGLDLVRAMGRNPRPFLDRFDDFIWLSEAQALGKALGVRGIRSKGHAGEKLRHLGEAVLRPLVLSTLTLREWPHRSSATQPVRREVIS